MSFLRFDLVKIYTKIFSPLILKNLDLSLNKNHNSKQPGNNQRGKGTKRNQRGRVKQVTYTNQAPPCYLPTVEDNNEEQVFLESITQGHLKTNIDSDILNTNTT